MRKHFAGYYAFKAEELEENFKKCVFTFDTNVLLNLYRYTPESQEKLFSCLQIIKDRVWLAHQVGIEYQRNRPAVLLKEINQFNDIEDILIESIKKLNNLRRTSLFTVNAIVDPINKGLDRLKKQIQAKRTKRPNLLTGDSVFDAVTELFNGKVGDPFSDKRYQEIYKEGKDRYDCKSPPGYEDRSKDPKDKNQYGDLILWYQLLEYAKTEARPIILVTDDGKEDWWRIVSGEKLGPRAELIAEFEKATGGGKWFYMYSTEQFLKHSNEYLSADVQAEVINEAERIDKAELSAGIEVPGHYCIFMAEGERDKIIEAENECFRQREIFYTKFIHASDGKMILGIRIAPGGSEDRVKEIFRSAGISIVELREGDAFVL